jgi:hypothetical protein
VCRSRSSSAGSLRGSVSDSCRTRRSRRSKSCRFLRSRRCHCRTRAHTRRSRRSKSCRSRRSRKCHCHTRPHTRNRWSTSCRSRRSRRRHCRTRPRRRRRTLRGHPRTSCCPSSLATPTTPDCSSPGTGASVNNAETDHRYLGQRCPLAIRARCCNRPALG